MFMAIFLVYVFALVSSLAFCAVLTKAVRDLVNRLGLAQGPASARHIHASPVPRFGGIAIFVTVFVGYGAYLLAVGHRFLPSPLNRDVFKVMLACIALFIAGLVDDFRPLSARTKLLIQVAGGLYLYVSGVRFACFHFNGAHRWGSTALCLTITVFWVVLVCNAINLIDGLDGLAAGAALFSVVTILTVAVLEGRIGVAVSAVLLAGSILGFLLFNFNPASIFLGDSGTLFIGFLLSGLVLAESPRQQSPIHAMFIPVLSLALPIADTFLSMARRFLSGTAVFAADREHIHHKLLDLGLGHRQVVAILYGFSALGSVAGLFLIFGSELLFIPVACTLALVVILGMRSLKYHELEEFQRVQKRTLEQRRIWARNISLRKIALQIRKARDISTLLQLMEKCLRDDFDGFEILMVPGLGGVEPFASGWNGLIQHFWNPAGERKLVLDIAILSAGREVMGHLLLHHTTSKDLLLDISLLIGNLREAVAEALVGMMRRAPVPIAFDEHAQASAAEPRSEFC